MKGVGFGLKVWGLGWFMVLGFELREFEAWGLGFRVSDAVEVCEAAQEVAPVLVVRHPSWFQGGLVFKAH